MGTIIIDNAIEGDGDDDCADVEATTLLLIWFSVLLSSLVCPRFRLILLPPSTIVDQVPSFLGRLTVQSLVGILVEPSSAVLGVPLSLDVVSMVVSSFDGVVCGCFVLWVGLGFEMQ